MVIDTLPFSLSVVQFLDAFIAAHQIRIRTLRARDKARLLATMKKKHEGEGKWWKGAEAVYIASVLLQLLLLPMGFYMYVLKRIFGPNMNVYSSLLSLHPQRNNQMLDGEEDPFAHYTLLYALVKRMQYLGSALLYGRVQMSMIKLRFSVIRGLIRRGVARPLRFYQRVRFVVRIAHWTHHWGPLFNKVKQFNESIHDLHIQFHQEREARRAKRARARSWKGRNEEESREYAAQIIQGAFRSHQVRSTTKALRVLTSHREYFAAKRLQRHFRAWLQLSRERIQRKREEFRLLKKEERIHRKQGEELDASRRLRMYELQRELNTNARKLINQQLLLKPDTPFAVAWKVLFVAVVAFDVSVLLIRPVVERSPDDSLAALLNKFFVAVRIPPELVCWVSQENDSIMRSLHDSCRKERTGKLFSFIEGATWIPKQKCQTLRLLPLYCESRLAVALEAAFIPVLQFVLRDFVSVLGIIRFLDISITFFTGEIDRTTGVLRPKPFFTRWIFPGLLLQALVNPSFNSLAQCVNPLSAWVRRHGPFRVLRWTVALFYPAALLLKALVLQQWLKFVKFENRW